MATVPLAAVTLANASEDALDLGVFVNGTADQSAVNRAGNRLRTLMYYQRRFEEALAAIGYEPAVAYTAGISLTRASQTVTYNGATYAPLATAIPFTTSGTFETAKFRLVQGATVEQIQDLINDLQSGLGSDLVGYLGLGDGGTLGTIGENVVERPANYGGISDGVTNDTAAVQDLKDQALADGRPVMVPDNTLHQVDLNGVLRVPTVWYEPREVDFAPEYQQRAFRGEAIIIDAEGDSTQKGALPSDTSQTAVDNAPARLQFILRAYFGNANIVVNNNGVNSASIRQMLEGSPPYSVPFEQRIAASAAQIVYCNHCINSAQIAQANGSLQQFKKDWHEVIKIVRKYGKTIIMSTPTPILPAPAGLGELFKPETQKQYVEMMRQVARETGTMLVDNYEYAARRIASGNTTTLAEVPDAIHPPNAGYAANGNNYAIPMVGQANHLDSTRCFLPSFSGSVIATNATAKPVPTSRTGGLLITSDGANRSVRIPVVVEEAGLDVYVAIGIWPSGASTASVWVDNVQVSDRLSFFTGFKNDAALSFIHDHEIRVIEDAMPGLHFIELKGGAPLAFSHVRTRKTRKRKYFNFAAGLNIRNTVLEDFTHSNTEANSVFLFDDIPTSRLTGFEAEIRAFIPANTGVVFNGSYAIGALDTNVVRAYPGYIVGADTDGFLSVWENQAGVNVKLLTTDFKPQFVPTTEVPLPYEYLSPRILVKQYAPDGTYTKGRIELIVNGASKGFATAANPYFGGLMGTWNNTAGEEFGVYRVSIVTHG